MKNEKTSVLSAFIEKLQSQGRYTFLKSEAIKSLGISKDAFKLAAWRLIQKKRLARPKQKFYLIVPFEHRSFGCPPVSWFIDDLMRYLQVPYYVGLLTAAAMYGAGHQQPNVFQVMTSKAVRPISVGSISIDFICNKLLEKTPIQKVQTPTGYMNVATPEATAYDLVKYLSLVGHINNVATVFIELQEKLREDSLVKIAHNIAPVRSIQRLGYVLDYINSEINTDKLMQLAKKKKAQYIPLIAGKKNIAGTISVKCSKNERWKILINEAIEPDL